MWRIEAQLKSLQDELDAMLQLDVPEYMVGRQHVQSELEDGLGELPFDRFDIMAGTAGKQVKVATLKAIVRVSKVHEPLPHVDQELFDAMMRPKEFVVRAYVLQGKGLIPHGSDGALDPYLVLRLGHQKQDNRKEHLQHVRQDAHFFRMFEFRTLLPGDSLLRIDVMDYDHFRLLDDCIGSTKIDLEDRIFCERWKRDLSSRPPLEWRNLYSPFSKHPQGEARHFDTCAHCPSPSPSTFTQGLLRPLSA